jgi:uncharacterized Ntn-hydrolase superfamily protein
MRISAVKLKTTLAATIALVIISPAHAFAEAREMPRRPVATYSIVARDATTGELGVAVQSHWFSVGSIVSWAEPGVGAVATQSLADPAYGPRGLSLMRSGKTAPEALTSLLASDDNSNVRQVAMIDADGNVANHTGEKSIAEYCDHLGEDYSVQANMMWQPTVCSAMAAGFESADGDLAAKLLAALDAAESAGGDVRGKQSAALLIVTGDISEPAWGGRAFDLRVEDHAEPLIELRRLVTLARAYRLMNAGDEHMTKGDIPSAVEAYSGAQALVPDSHEMVFWHAVTMAAAGEVDEAMPLFKKAFDAWPKWRELVRRLPAAELLPADRELMQRILAIE